MRVRTGSDSDWVLRLNVRLFDPYRVGIVLCRDPRVAAFGLTLGYYLRPLRGRKADRCRRPWAIIFVPFGDARNGELGYRYSKPLFSIFCLGFVEHCLLGLV